MADFFTELFNSIFTPGPTPSLVYATNAAFAALQLVLIGLLLATFSIHFLVLSLLSGALWFGINWFAREVALAQAEAKQEAQGDEKGRESTGAGVRGETGGGGTRKGEGTGTGAAAGPSGGAGEDGPSTTLRRKRKTRRRESRESTAASSGTETEDAAPSLVVGGQGTNLPAMKTPTAPGTTVTLSAPGPAGGIPRQNIASLEAGNDDASSHLSKRRSMGEVSGTDSEWDKVSETEGLGE